jgi:hypothetical protein
MSDLQELKRHVRLLEDHFEWGSYIAAEISELSARIEEMTESFDENLSAMARAFTEMRTALDRNTETLEELVRLARRRK